MTEMKVNLAFADSQPIKNTRLRRYATLAAIKLLQRFRPQCGRVLFLTKGICIKYGPLTYLSEASAMEFVGQKTSIPVPRIYCAFERRGSTYIVMQHIKGETLTRGWLRRSSESKTAVRNQLKSMMDEMRAIPPPPSRAEGVCNVDGGPLFDCRMIGTDPRFGPFSNVQEFHKYLRDGYDAHPDQFPEINDLVHRHQSGVWPSVFTHADLSSMNIIARGDEVVGIIDWESAGWYPSYWEYTSAWNANPGNAFWQQEVDHLLEPMPSEVQMEALRRKYFHSF